MPAATEKKLIAARRRSSWDIGPPGSGALVRELHAAGNGSHSAWPACPVSKKDRGPRPDSALRGMGVTNSIGHEQLVEFQREELVQSLPPLAGVEHTEGQLPSVVERHLQDDVVDIYA